MSETTTVPTVETPKVAKPVKVKKASKPAPAKAKSELRPLQLRVLEVLAKKGPMNRAKMYEALKFKAQSGLNDVLGKNDLKIRAKMDKEKYPCLLTLKAITLKELDIDGHTERVYEIAATGRKMLAKAST